MKSNFLLHCLDQEEQLAISHQEMEEGHLCEDDLRNCLDALQQAAFGAVGAVNAGGVLLEDRLWAMPDRVKEVVTQGIHQGAATSLSMKQLHSGHDLLHLEPGLLVASLAEEEEKQEELVDDFTIATSAIENAINVEEVMLHAFLG